MCVCVGGGGGGGQCVHILFKLYVVTPVLYLESMVLPTITIKLYQRSQMPILADQAPPPVHICRYSVLLHSFTS